jgi:HAD superfamily hydrolase (TIGR01484 family)
MRALLIYRQNSECNFRTAQAQILTLRFLIALDYNWAMKNLAQFSTKIKILLTDIDDTLTDEGLLGPEAYQALWQLHRAGVQVIPITGRPAGWCEMIARQWPVHGVVGENGGFYFRYADKKMRRHFFFDEAARASHRSQLDLIENEVLSNVPGSAVASDQFCRLMDLAIDFCEDVPPLSKTDVQKIIATFTSHGAQAKVSSIHVNGWFGAYDKLSMTLLMLEKEFGVSPEQAKIQCAFTGDSPNDEPMFAYFPHSFAVANIQNFIDDLKEKPTFVALSKGGLGFAEIARQILSVQTQTKA